jgi:GWxTD domain-containing protein
VKKKSSYFLLIIIAVFFLCGSKKKETNNLPPRYKTWLEEDVVYIMAPIEREVFLKLETDRERDLFQEAFWKHRDPTPGTPANEFKQEHYRRINYANHFFGRGIPKPGWKTDRGRIYIILGEPNDIQRFEGKTMVYPSEVWFYQGLSKFGLPPGFHVVFFQQGGFGEFKLYSPLKDGPQALMTSYWGDAMDYLSAYSQLKDFEPELAQVSLSLIPGEGGAAAIGRPSLSSDLLLQRVETTAIRQIEEKYAKKFLEYKDIVEVEYTANYIDNDSLVKVIKDRSGFYFVHYAIEPAKLSVGQYEHKYYANLKLNGTVSNLEGKSIYQFEKTISLDLDEERIKSIRRQPLLIQDMFPLIPGNYKLSILVKNETSKEFTSLERNLVIPQDDQALQMTSLILGYNIKKSIPQQNRLRPFQEGEYQVYFQANRVFLRTDNLIIVFQIHGLGGKLKEKGEVRFTFLKGGEEFFSKIRKIAEYQDLPNILEQFDLDQFPPAHYRVQVSLLVDGQEVLFDSEEFDITHLEAIARPWVYSKMSPGTQDPLHFYLIGTQLFNSGKIAEARVNLEKAFFKKPDSVDYALNLAQTYMVLNEYKKVESVLLPFINKTEPPQYEVFFMMGKAYQSLGELGKAIEILDNAISHYGININLLNTIGECYFQLGEPEAALVAWQKSLEINPNQPQIKKSVEALKEKK